MPMTADTGDCLFTAMEIENTVLAAPRGYYAGMGFGVPGGIGVAAATGRRPLILVGDGAMQMTGWELGNCRRYGLDPIVVLFNNASWEMLRAFQPESHFNDLDDWNYAAIAPSLGGHGERVTTRRELKNALERAAAKSPRCFLWEPEPAWRSIAPMTPSACAAFRAAPRVDMRPRPHHRSYAPAPSQKRCSESSFSRLPNP